MDTLGIEDLFEREGAEVKGTDIVDQLCFAEFDRAFTHRGGDLVDFDLSGLCPSGKKWHGIGEPKGKDILACGDRCTACHRTGREWCQGAFYVVMGIVTDEVELSVLCSFACLSGECRER